MGGLFLLFQSRYMHEHLKVKQDCGNMTVIRKKMNPPLFMGTEMRNHLLSVHLTKGIYVPRSVILSEATAERVESKNTLEKCFQ